MRDQRRARITRVRFVLPVVAVLVACSTAHAQSEVAPAPHPALSELVKEYKRLGLPLLPPNAELVRLRRDVDPDDRSGENYCLAYRVPGAKPSHAPRYFIGDCILTGFLEVNFVEPEDVEETEPTPDAFRAVQSWDGRGLLTHAVQCWERGWNHLATHLYHRACERFMQDEGTRPVFNILRANAWSYWQGSLFTRDSDRKSALRQLEALVVEDPEYKEDPTLKQLRLTFAPSRSQPGSVEALIDELTEYWNETEYSSLARAKPASYWKLAALGFDAVPTLIEHLSDDRLSRAKRWRPNGMAPATVGDLCSLLLADLSAGLLPERAKPAEVEQWFAKAKQGGEEEWLVDHALKVTAVAAANDRQSRIRRHLVWTLGARFPERLPEVYRTALKEPADYPWTHPGNAEVIAASRLSRAQKLALLEEGAISSNDRHCVDALGALAALDPQVMRKHLIATLKWAIFRAWFWGTTASAARHFVPLVERAGDRTCWALLADLCKCEWTGHRVITLEAICGVYESLYAPDPHQTERMRFLIQFLNDAETLNYLDGTAVSVRDCAAVHLSIYTGLRALTPQERAIALLPPSLRDRGPFSRAVFRAAVWQAALRELAAKP